MYHMYGSWDVEWDRYNFLSLWAIFVLLPPCNLENKNFVRIKKVPGDIIILHMKNHDHMMYAS